MKPLRSEKPHSKLFKGALKDLTGTRRKSAEDHINHITEDKKAIETRQKRLSEIDAELEAVLPKLKNLKDNFLSLSDKKQEKLVVEIIDLERKRDALQEEKTKTQREIARLEAAIENRKKALDDVRQQEHEFRQREVERQKQELQDARKRNRAHEFKTQHYIPIKTKLLQPITAANFDEVKAIINRYPSLNEWVAEFGDDDFVVTAYPRALLKKARGRVLDFSREQELFEQK